MVQMDIKDLSLGYENQIVCSNVNFQINSGDYLCIVGENGSGKSTLVKTLIGLEKPIKGEINLVGIKRSDIGYLPQKFEIKKDFPGSVLEITMSGFLGSMGIRPFYKKNEYEKAISTLELLGIEDLKDKCYRDLSGGQMQRVLLARAITATNKMIILDEPVTGLDPEATFEMYGIIRHLNHNMGITVVMISHDLDAVDKYNSHILTMGREVIYR